MGDYGSDIIPTIIQNRDTLLKPPQSALSQKSANNEYSLWTLAQPSRLLLSSFLAASSQNGTEDRKSQRKMKQKNKSTARLENLGMSTAYLDEQVRQGLRLPFNLNDIAGKDYTPYMEGIHLDMSTSYDKISQAIGTTTFHKVCSPLLRRASVGIQGGCRPAKTGAERHSH